MTPERLAEIEERCKKATEGPWGNAGWSHSCAKPEHAGGHPGPPECVYDHHRKLHDDEEGAVYWARYVSSDAIHEEIIGSDEDGPILSLADATFIAHARTDLPEAIEEIKRLQKRVEELEKKQ